MSYQEHAVATTDHDDADSRVDVWSAFIVLVALAAGFLLLASNFDGAL